MMPFIPSLARRWRRPFRRTRKGTAGWTKLLRMPSMLSKLIAEGGMFPHWGPPWRRALCTGTSRQINWAAVAAAGAAMEMETAMILEPAVAAVAAAGAAMEMETAMILEP